MGPGQDRAFIEEQFTGRAGELASLLKVARQDSTKRIILLGGDGGIGKSWLLHMQKLRAGREIAGIALVGVDFSDPPLGQAEWGYLDIVQAAREQLGGAGFEAMDALVDSVRRELAGLGLADPFATQLTAPWAGAAAIAGAAAGAAAAAAAAPAGDTIDVATGDIGAQAQVVVGSQNVMAQGDVNFYVVNQAPGQGNKGTLLYHQQRITAAFQAGLASITASRFVVFQFDGWLQASTPTREWLCDALLARIRDKELAGAAAIVADDAGIPELKQVHPLVAELELAGLSEDEVRVYWVEKRGLAPDKVAMATEACSGLPGLLALIADRHAAKSANTI